MSDPMDFGVPQLDRLLGPLPATATVALLNDPGVEAEPFLYQSAYHHLSRGRAVVYAVFNRPPSSVRRAMREFGFDPDAPLAKGANLVFLDAFSPLMGSSEGAPYVLKNAKDVDALSSLLEKAAEEHPGAVLHLDTLSTVVDTASFDAFRAALPRLVAAMKRFRFSTALFTKWPYEGDLLGTLGVFDAVVTLRGVQERIMLSQYFAVEKIGWAPLSDSARPGRPILYKTLKPGGVYVYVPKVVVTGAYHAGKSTFIQTLSDVAVSVNRLGTTVAMDHGRVTLDGLTADVFGTPGQSRFDPILKTISAQALGVVLVVDSTAPDSFPRAREMLEQTWRQGLPVVVAANKQDAPGALSPQEVGARLALPPLVQVVGCISSDKAQCVNVLRRLVDQIMGLEAIA